MYFDFAQYKQKGQILIWIIVGALIITIAGGAYYLGRSISPKSSPTAPVVSQTPQPTPIPSSTSSPNDETANWKTYTNSTFGYLLKYPADWTVFIPKTENLPPVSNSDASISLIPPDLQKEPFGGLTIGVEDNPSNMTISNWVNDYLKKLQINYKGDKTIIEVGGYQAEMLKDLPSMNGEAYHVFLVKGDKVYNFVIEYKSNGSQPQISQAILTQILSTFRFTQ